MPKKSAVARHFILLTPNYAAAITRIASFDRWAKLYNNQPLRRYAHTTVGRHGENKESIKAASTAVPSRRCFVPRWHEGKPDLALSNFPRFPALGLPPRGGCSTLASVGWLQATKSTKKTSGALGKRLLYSCNIQRNNSMPSPRVSMDYDGGVDEIWPQSDSGDKCLS